MIMKNVWIVILKIWNTIRHGLSMLWPDKSFTTRLCFGMAFLCTMIFVINAAFTLVYSCGLIIFELGHRADKELKVAKMICDREEQRSDTISTDQLFKMIKSSGIDEKYTLCITDSTDSILACNDKAMKETRIDFGSSTDVNFEMEDVNLHIIHFNNTMNICLNDSIAGTGYNILLIEPMDNAMESAIDVVKEVGKSSLICFIALVVCYLVILYFLRRTTSKNEQIQSELDVAASIQKQMVPLDFSMFPESHGYNLNGMLKPAKTMGGDLLDYVLRDDKLFFCIGDVSGKGMPAALCMSEVHVLFHHVLTFTQDPADICSAINRSLAEGNDTNMFCTFFTGVIDFSTNRLSYCNAGHNPPVMIDDKGNASFIDCIPNIALGLVDEFPFQAQEMDFVPDSIIVTYTDGVTEAESIDKHTLGDKALLDMLKNRNHLKPDELIALITNKINEHTKLTEQSDDITMLVVKSPRT